MTAQDRLVQVECNALIVIAYRQTHNVSTRAGTEQPITVDRRQDRDAVTHNTSAALLTALQGRTTSQPKNISLRNVHLQRTHNLMIRKERL